jgi:3-oxoacyl-[acyl-carrier-protein] synthase-1/3-oxoacyl-[acyl-carrier-protein] synthase II
VTGFKGAVIDYRKVTGEFATASAVAVVMAVDFVKEGRIPEPFCRQKDVTLMPRGALVVGLGDSVTAVEVMCP